MAQSPYRQRIEATIKFLEEREAASSLRLSPIRPQHLTQMGWLPKRVA